jgi:ribosomal protein L25 (general stress protein Ctc)
MTKKNELLTIDGSLRSETGKGYNRKLRKKGLIPAAISKDGKSINLELNPKLLSKAWQSGKEFILTLGKDSQKVFIQELQINVMTREALYVDLKSL